MTPNEVGMTPNGVENVSFHLPPRIGTPDHTPPHFAFLGKEERPAPLNKLRSLTNSYECVRTRIPGCSSLTLS